MSASSWASGSSWMEVSATKRVRPRAMTTDRPIRVLFTSRTRLTSFSAMLKLRVTPVTMASASPWASMAAPK